MEGRAMEPSSLFAQMAPMPEPVIARLLFELRHDVEESAPAEIDLARLADTAVRELWGSSVKVFVPVLALRRAREVLRAADPPAARPDPIASMASPSEPAPGGEHGRIDDKFLIDDDILIDQDTLTPD